MMRRFLKLLFILLFACGSVHGQRSSAIQDKKDKSSIAAIPVINYNRTQGVIVGALVSYFYKINKEDTISPSSNIGIFGMYTAQKSYATFGFSRFYFHRDLWRITAAAGIVDINF